ncbi:UNVERIFIED_CONTAM: hypothetical protein Sradi_4532100 [Sesamum radiatum]|uniref:Uncharacterized protein n=1 Tax=Sesamum radiatum TaxID=300843 RepID=A0AAW2NAJ3_SESRA
MHARFSSVLEQLQTRVLLFQLQLIHHEILLSKNIKAWTLRATQHEPPCHQPSDDFAHLCTLDRSIIEGDAKWDGDLRFTGEFRYTKGYWEWTEDVLSRCEDRLRHLKEEVYLVAYLACWLCVFVLPGKDVNSIRPSTFKMASLMVNGRRVNLAILVLASIYEGLNTVELLQTSRYESLFSYPVCLCMASMLLQNSLLGLARVAWSKDDEIFWKRSYLTLRQGDRFIIDPYNPHRFGRQFGYYQDVPGTLRYDTRVASLEEGLSYWRICVLSKSSSKAWFPCLPANAKKLCSEAYKAWWAKVHRNFFDDNIACLIKSKSIKITLKRKKDEEKQVDDGENDPPHALIPPIVIECILKLPLRRQVKENVLHIMWQIVIVATRIVIGKGNGRKLRL